MGIGFADKTLKKPESYAYFDYEMDGLSKIVKELSDLQVFISQGTNWDLNRFFGYEVNDPRNADLVIFNDRQYPVNPSLYNHRTLDNTHVSKVSLDRDQIELELFYHTIDMPKLGIGTGAQFLAVMNGAALFQKVTKHVSYHDLITSEGETFIVNSDHNAMMDLQGLKNYKLLAWTDGLSDYYCSGSTSEALINDKLIVLPGTRVKEPEVVYFPSTNSLCIQYKMNQAMNQRCKYYTTEQILNII